MRREGVEVEIKKKFRLIDYEKVIETMDKKGIALQRWRGR